MKTLFLVSLFQFIKKRNDTIGTRIHLHSFSYSLRISDKKTDRQYYKYYEWTDRYCEWKDEYYEWTDKYYAWTDEYYELTDKYYEWRNEYYKLKNEYFEWEKGTTSEQASNTIT